MMRDTAHLSGLFLSVVIGALVASGCERTGSSGSEFGELVKLADRYGTDKASWKHKFAELYEHFFAPLRYSTKRVFEIGVLQGQSLKMLRDYFPNAIVYGIDIEDTASLNSERMKTFVADQSDRKQLQAFLDFSGGEAFDIIIDDGGHAMHQQQISFGFLLPHLRPGGYYIIEDLHSSMIEGSYGVGPDRTTTTLAMVNRFIRTGKIESIYMSPAELAHLNAELEYCALMSRNRGRSITAVFKKKVPRAAHANAH